MGGIIRRVLVVEDDPELREAVRALLARAGYRVSVAADGVTAWDLIVRGPRFAVVVLDLYTPRMTGHDLVARVRRTPRLREVPIIAMSGDARGDVPAAQAFLAKPFSSEELHRALADVGAPVA